MSTCYNPDGTVTGYEDYPCWNTTAERDHAPCCPNDTYCFSSGFCLSGHDMTTFRAGCTDKSWNSDYCVKKCTGTNGSAFIGGIYKCDDHGNAGCLASDCGTDKQFPMASGSLLLSGAAVSSVLGASHYALQSGSSTTAASATSSHSDINQSNGENVQSNSIDNQSNGSNKFSAGALAGVGVGIGLPLAIALLAALFFLFKERKKNRQLQQQHSPAGYQAVNKDIVDNTADTSNWQTPQSDNSQMALAPKPVYEVDSSTPSRGELPSSSARTLHEK